MSLSIPVRRAAGWAGFLLGLLILFAFNALAVAADLSAASFWGDPQDAVAFDRSQPAAADLTGMRCPILLAPGEPGAVAAVFRNPHAGAETLSIKAAVSARGRDGYRSLEDTLSLPAGARGLYTYPVAPADAIQGGFILTRAFLINNPDSIPYPARTGSCGVFVWSLPGLPGAASTALISAVGLALLAAGIFFLSISALPLRNTFPRLDHGLYGLGGVLAAGLAANLLGWWVAALVLLLLAVLLVSVLVPNLAAHR